MYRYIKKAGLVALVFAACLLGGCALKQTDYGHNLGNYAHQNLISFLNENPSRQADSPGERQAANYIKSYLKTLSLDAKSLPFEYDTQWKTHMTSENIYLYMPAEGDKKAPTVLLGAHYDNAQLGQGADDNASGVASLLTLATYFKEYPLENVNLAFVFFGSEEVGLKGSTAYAGLIQSGQTPKPDLMINFDSLIAGDHRYVYGSTHQNDVLGQFLKIASSSPYEILTQDEPRSGLPYGSTLDASDHAPFKALGIEFLYFEATNWAIGHYDGYTQTDNPKVENGEIWHTEMDQLSVIESLFPNRPEENLQAYLYTTVEFLEQFTLK